MWKQFHSHFLDYLKPSIRNHLSKAIFALRFIVIMVAMPIYLTLYFATSMAGSAYLAFITN
jgi:hypothetical protein